MNCAVLFKFYVKLRCKKQELHMINNHLLVSYLEKEES